MKKHGRERFAVIFYWCLCLLEAFLPRSSSELTQQPHILEPSDGSEVYSNDVFFFASIPHVESYDYRTRVCWKLTSYFLNETSTACSQLNSLIWNGTRTWLPNRGVYYLQLFIEIPNELAYSSIFHLSSTFTYAISVPYLILIVFIFSTSTWPNASYRSLRVARACFCVLMHNFVTTIRFSFIFYRVPSMWNQKIVMKGKTRSGSQSRNAPREAGSAFA